MAVPRATELREGVEYRGEARAHHMSVYHTPWLFTQARNLLAPNHTNPNGMALPLSTFPAYLRYPSGCESRQIGLPRFLPHLWRLFLRECLRPIILIQRGACAGSCAQTPTPPSQPRLLHQARPIPEVLLEASTAAQTHRRPQRVRDHTAYGRLSGHCWRHAFGNDGQTCGYQPKGGYSGHCANCQLVRRKGLTFL